MSDPNAPLVQCMDCEDGTSTCPNCGGVGSFKVQVGRYTVIETCDSCWGDPGICATCEGFGEYEDPDYAPPDEEEDLEVPCATA
jgi:DnaJ-class molecular chaperone